MICQLCHKNEATVHGPVKIAQAPLVEAARDANTVTFSRRNRFREVARCAACDAKAPKGRTERMAYFAAATTPESPVSSYRVKINGRYLDEMPPEERARHEVKGDRLGEMLAAGTPPQIRTTSTFLADTRLGGGQFQGPTRDVYLRAAAQAGVSVAGKVYEPRIAAFPGDPQAWIEGPDDVRRVLEARGWSSDGDVKVKGREVKPAADVPIADDIVESLVENRLVAELGEDFTEASGAVVERAREDVLNAHTAPARLNLVSE